MRSFIRLLLAFAMSALGVTPAAPADEATFYTATYVEVVPPSTAQGAALLRQYREASRKDAGNVRFEVLQRIDRPNQLTVLAAWTDQKAFEAHLAAAATREFRDKLRPLLASPNDERLHNGLSVGPTPAAGAGPTDRALCNRSSAGLARSGCSFSRHSFVGAAAMWASNAF